MLNTVRMEAFPAFPIDYKLKVPNQVKVYFIIFDDIISALILQVERLESSV